ncbi:hypothetical protein [Paraburkholderia tuberum]|nr:hypothetical protein [Paraburkholderia tuberum]
MTIRRALRELATMIDWLILADRNHIDRPMKDFYQIEYKCGYAVSGGIARKTRRGVAHAVAAPLAKTIKVKGHGYVMA